MSALLWHVRGIVKTPLRNQLSASPWDKLSKNQALFPSREVFTIPFCKLQYVGARKKINFFPTDHNSKKLLPQRV
jgi:hypothetical protein